MNLKRKLLYYNVSHKHKRRNASLAFSHSEKKGRSEKSQWNSDLSIVLASEEEIPELKGITVSSLFTFSSQLIIAINRYICMHVFHLHK